MSFDEIHVDLSRQFAAIAKKFMPILSDRSIEICDLVQEGLILASTICNSYDGSNSRQIKSIAITAFVNHLKGMSRLRLRRRKFEDNTEDFEKIVDVLSDETFSEKLMLKIFLRELGDLLSRFDSAVLEELMMPDKSAAAAVKAKNHRRRVTVNETHLAQAFNKNRHDIALSVTRIRSAVAREFFL